MMNINIVVFNAAGNSQRVYSAEDLVKTAKEFQFQLEESMQTIGLQHGDLMSLTELHETNNRHDCYALSKMLNDEFCYVLNHRGKRDQVIAAFYRRTRFSLIKKASNDGGANCLYHDRFVGVFLKDRLLGLKILFISVHLPHKGSAEKISVRNQLKTVANLYKDRVHVIIIAGGFNAVPSEFVQTFPKFDEHNIKWVYAISKDTLPTIKAEARPNAFDNVIFTDNDYLKYMWQPSLERKFANKFDHYPFLFQLIDKEVIKKTLDEFLDLNQFLKSKVEIGKRILAVLDRLLEKETKLKRDEWNSRKTEFLKTIRYPYSCTMKKEALDNFQIKITETIRLLDRIMREDHIKVCKMLHEHLMEINNKVKSIKGNIKSADIMLCYLEEIRAEQDTKTKQEIIRLKKQKAVMVEDQLLYKNQAKMELTKILSEWRALRNEMKFAGTVAPLNEEVLENRICELLTMNEEMVKHVRLVMTAMDDDMETLATLPSEHGPRFPYRKIIGENVSMLLPRQEFPSYYCELVYLQLYDLMSFCLNC